MEYNYVMMINRTGDNVNTNSNKTTAPINYRERMNRSEVRQRDEKPRRT